MRLAHTVLFTALATTAALAGPPLRGPEIYSGAWQTTQPWSDPAAGPGDPSEGSFAYAYQTWAETRASRHADDGTRLDCADLSISLLCEYAALHGLPVTWRVYYPAEKRFLIIRNTDRQFKDAEAFSEWSRWYLGAINLADNTDAIGYDEWAGGDMVLMDWNQSDVTPNFEGRVVWHTYLVGIPGEIFYYGNIDNGQALPVTRTSSSSTLERVTTHPDRFGFSPRRFSQFRGHVWDPSNPPAGVVTPDPTGELATVIRANRLNLRGGPGTSFPVRRLASRGERFQVLAREGRWVQLQSSQGPVWAHSYYLRIQGAAASPSLGLLGALGQ